jgi:virginiamycin B lyase
MKEGVVGFVRLGTTRRSVVAGLKLRIRKSKGQFRYARTAFRILSTAALSGLLIAPAAGLVGAPSTSVGLTALRSSGPVQQFTTYTSKSIKDPMGITAGSDGALWFTNYNGNSIGRITTSGAITHYKASGIDDPFGITNGPDGALWFTNYGGNSIGRITTSGAVSIFTDSTIDEPEDITTGSDGGDNFWTRQGIVVHKL